MKPRIFLSQIAIIIILSLALLLAACGGNNTSSSSGSTDSSSTSSNQPVVATMPPAQFTAVANQSAAATNIVTKTNATTSTQTVSSAQAVTTAQVASANTGDLERGARAYAKNKCNECHGEKGEVVAGKTTKAIGGTTVTAEQFDQFLRTGGGLGDIHIFGPSAISPGGMQALYAYVKSLPGK